MIQNLLNPYPVMFFKPFQMLQNLPVEFLHIPCTLPNPFSDASMSEIPSSIVPQQKETSHIPQKPGEVQTAPLHPLCRKDPLQILLPQTVSRCRNVPCRMLHLNCVQLLSDCTDEFYAEAFQILRQTVYHLFLVFCDSLYPIAPGGNLHKFSLIHHYKTLDRQAQIQWIIRSFLCQNPLHHWPGQFSPLGMKDPFRYNFPVPDRQWPYSLCSLHRTVISWMETIQIRAHHLYFI